jgi:shikimate dehydrogenase
VSSIFDFDADPDLYAVMGNPIAHSKSPQIHTAFAQETRQRMRYIAILVEPGGFSHAVGNFRAEGGKGLNITVPFKHEAWKLVSERTPRAERAGAVNTVLFRPDGTTLGDTTDGVGLVRDIVENYAGQLAQGRVLILGAGGAVRGVLEALLAQRPARLVIANRTVDKAQALAREFSVLGPVEGGGYGELQGETFDFIINGTAASLYGQLPPLAEGVLAPGGWCYDMAYGDRPTPFVLWGLAHGAGQALDGTGMLVEQAAESFYLWRGVRPHTAPVIELLKKTHLPG